MMLRCCLTTEIFFPRIPYGKSNIKNSVHRRCLCTVVIESESCLFNYQVVLLDRRQLPLDGKGVLLNLGPRNLALDQSGKKTGEKGFFLCEMLFFGGNSFQLTCPPGGLTPARAGPPAAAAGGSRCEGAGMDMQTK